MTNLLEAIINISKLEDLKIENISFGKNRANDMGEGLESFVKNAFANTFGDVSERDKISAFSDCFSYEGSKSTPPDLMLKNGDALEIKKMESLTGELQLNSSHPKAKLFSTSSLINSHCKDCENWTEKDFIYVIGHIQKYTNILSSLWLIDGEIYAADEDVYLGLKESVSKLLEDTDGINFSKTKELGRVNAVDPLRITNLRIRGMWLLQPSYNVFSYVHEYDTSAKFQVISILSEAKYQKYPQESRNKIEVDPRIEVKNIEVKNPNNPVQLIPARLISFKINE